MKNVKPVKLRKKRTCQTTTSSKLRFTPTAWAKLVFLRDLGPTEVGGFGISSKSDSLLIEDVQLVQQTCDWASVVFDDEAVADYFDYQVEAGRQPEEFGRVWIHSHPGDSAIPSVTDESTFLRVFGTNPWAVMFILARGGASYARLRFNVGPGGSLHVPVEVDYGMEFGASDHSAWQVEYDRCVEPNSLPLADELDQGIDPFEVEDEWSWWDRMSEPWNLTEVTDEEVYL